MLANETGDTALAAEAAQPLAYTFAAVGLWQADHGYRGALPTFMQFSCIRGFYSAAFETHNTLWSMHRVLQLSASLPAPMRLPAHVTEAMRTIVIPWGLGMLRYAYPDKLPSFVLAPLACPGGPGSCESYGNMSNDATVSIPVEVRRRLPPCLREPLHSVLLFCCGNSLRLSPRQDYWGGTVSHRCTFFQTHGILLALILTV